MAQRLGLQRAVLVQPTIYGTDNRLLLDTLAQDRCCRGVCAIDDHTSDAELRALDIVGVCGIRVTSIPGGQAAHDYLRQTAGRIAPLGWHMQLYIGPGLLLKLHRTMADLPVEVVLDHFAGLSAAHAKACDERDALASLLETGRCWIKLSGAYRASLNGPPYRDVQALARWLIAVNEERLVWGSDWPHAHLRGRPMPNDGALLNLLAEQAIDDSQRHRILVDNPAALYRYD
jgi:predicted TIM-barrel fold metal-dependent hydrolase